jgi:urea transporter
VGGITIKVMLIISVTWISILKYYECADDGAAGFAGRLCDLLLRSLLTSKCTNEFVVLLPVMTSVVMDNISNHVLQYYG